MAALQEKPNEARRRDGVILVVQNNATHALTITHANETISNTLGYSAGDLTHHSLLEILGEKSTNLIQEEITFEDDAPDFGDIFSRQTSLRLRTRAGQEIVRDCTIMRVMAEDAHAKFQLVLPDTREVTSKLQLREFLKLNLEGSQILDSDTGLPDRASAIRYLEVLKNYLTANDMSACFAVLRLDRYERSLARYGKQNCVDQLHHVANCCRGSFRSEDLVSVLSESTLGLMLFDISRESARMVLNRLRWNVRNHRIALGGKADFSVTVSVTFDMIGTQSADAMVLACESAAKEIAADERNILSELGL